MFKTEESSGSGHDETIATDSVATYSYSKENDTASDNTYAEYDEEPVDSIVEDEFVAVEEEVVEEQPNHAESSDSMSLRGDEDYSF